MSFVRHSKQQMSLSNYCDDERRNTASQYRTHERDYTLLDYFNDMRADRVRAIPEAAREFEQRHIHANETEDAAFETELDESYNDLEPDLEHNLHATSIDSDDPYTFIDIGSPRCVWSDALDRDSDDEEVIQNGYLLDV